MWDLGSSDAEGQNGIMIAGSRVWLPGFESQLY